MNSDNIRKFIDEALASGGGVIPEEKAKKIFSAHGIPVVSEVSVENPEDAGDAAAAVGFPVVLKASGKAVLHKTEAGLVQKGLAQPVEVTAAARRMSRSSGDIESFLIQPQVEGNREFVAGVFRDPLFGPVVLFGLGGIMTEVLDDAVIRVAPLSDPDIESMLEGIKAKELLEGFRGEPPVDKGVLRQILRSLSELATAYPEIREIDINPILVAKDGGPVAVDGLILVSEPVRLRTGEREVDRQAFKACFYPKSVAFVGASATLAKWGHSLPANLLSRDFKGDIFLVNPRGGELMGKKVYSSVLEIDSGIDLAVVTVPAAKVIPLLPQLQERGVKAMLLITSGFRETGEEGALLEERLVEEAEKAGILVFGPNTMGICNPSAELFCCGVHVYPQPGSTALVCQSGNMGTQLLAFAEQQDIGIRAFSGSGNEAMVTVEDYMEVFVDDEGTRTVVLYVESIKDGRRFFETARKVSRKKPVVILKGGRTREGGEAASSHTGAIASDFKVFEAACSQAGIIQVKQPVELLDLSSVFSSLPLPRGNRVAIMTLGGGWGVITTDLCLENGLTVPVLPQPLIEKLNSLLPSYWSHGNPVDIVGENDPNIPMVAVEELMKWDGCDAVIHLGIHGKRILASRMFDSVSRTDNRFPPQETEKLKKMINSMEKSYIEHVVGLTRRYEKPVLGVSLFTDEDQRTLYRVGDGSYKGVFFPSPERAVKALAGMCRYRQWLEKN